MIAALVIGLVGSLHCIGMCGPLALALPGKNLKGGAYVTGRLLYNSGRILTYSILGGIVAMLGVAAAMFSLQQYVSLGLGILLLVLAMREWGLFGGRRRLKRNPWMGKLLGYTGSWMQKGGPKSLFMIGLLNGLLPCGFVYVGLFHAALSETMWEGALKMILFGLGTWPVMLALSLSGKWITPFLRKFSGRGLALVMIIMGSLLVVRGMALGIPYVSPAMEVSMAGNPDQGFFQGEDGEKMVMRIPICH